MPHRKHLAKDARLKPLVKAHEVLPLKPQRNIYYELTTCIMAQQLNVKVARIINDRFLALYGNKKPTPQQVLDTPEEQLRSIGLSRQKAQYMHNIARFALEHGMEAKVLNKMTDEEVIAYLTQIKGVGRWTVEMVLMFAMGREDIFSAGDYGVQSAMAALFGIKMNDKKKLLKKMHQIAEQWAPYRSYACMYLWRYKDNAPK